MKRSLLFSIAVCTALLMAIGINGHCAKIQDGTILYSPGHYLYGRQPIKTGYDIFGYNYQAHMFNGSYANVYLGRDGLPPYLGDTQAYLAQHPEAASKWYWPYRDVQLVMKWNDAWLSNQDNDSTPGLDRHLGYPSYIGSGAWETNHMSGSDNGQKWTYFTKIVAAPANATNISGIWYSNGTAIGPAIWGAFATIQEVNSGEGATYVSPAKAGLGNW
jgi:hypothetical protein